MCEPDNKTAIVFGGSGFVGRHLVRHFLDSKLYGQIIIGDLVQPPIEDECLVYLHTDVRSWIDPEPYRAIVQKNDATIYNLAAICRIPGYPDKDYFETNIRGAETVLAFADEIGCKTIVFTSTIAVYGASEEEKREDSLPMPDNPYGISKLIAEEIHKTWQATDPAKNLSILRPGIIFGQDENANFTRLYRSIARRYFLYPGRRDTRKAAIYVKDVAALCHHFAENMTGLTVYNLTYPAAYTIEEICMAISKVTGKPKPLIKIPAWILLLVANSLYLFACLIGKSDIRFHPDRIRKLMVSTNISGKRLEEAGHYLQFDLEEAILDWYKDCGEKGLF